MIRRERIEEGVRTMLSMNMGLKEGEILLVLTDVPTLSDWMEKKTNELAKMVQTTFLAKEVFEIAKQDYLTCSVEFYVYPSVGKSGAEPPEEVAKRMMGSIVVIAINTYSLTHTEARERASKTGSRIASMPGFSPEMFYPGGVMSVDYKRMKEESRALVRLITSTDGVIIYSPGGTDLKLSIKGREPKASLGELSEKGAWGNLPGGEVYVAPLEGTANGRIVVEKARYSTLSEDMVLTFQNGQVTEVVGGGQMGDHYRSLLDCDKMEEPYLSRRNCAELGIGLNPNAKRPDNLLEAEKIRGTVHIAIGDNSHFGGKVKADVHQDFVIFKPTLEFDGKAVIQKGRLFIR
jgi:leucyl aminopeptidase (aminopeptidase T)